MNNAAFHLNLLKPTEHLSSSPIRFRVLAPLIAFFAIIGMIVWWGSVFAQVLLIETGTKAIAAENASNAKAEADAKKIQDEFIEMDAQLKQLKGYANSIRRIGPALTRLAEEFPMDLQIAELSVSALPAQDLTPLRKGPRQPLLRGPTNAVEVQTFSLIGRTRQPDLVQKDLLEVFRHEPLEPLSALAAPRKLDCRPETTDAPGGSNDAASGSPSMKFTVSYAMPARTFSVEQKGSKK